jgi:hypothetical protein
VDANLRPDGHCHLRHLVEVAMQSVSTDEPTISFTGSNATVASTLPRTIRSGHEPAVTE